MKLIRTSDDTSFNLPKIFSMMTISKDYDPEQLPDLTKTDEIVLISVICLCWLAAVILFTQYMVNILS